MYAHDLVLHESYDQTIALRHLELRLREEHLRWSTCLKDRC